MPNFEIADAEIRAIVKNLIDNGIPPAFTEPHELTEKQIEAYIALDEAREIFGKTVDQEADQRGELPTPGSEWWNGCLAFRQALQVALKSDLLRAPMVQQNMVDFGAVPDPEWGWKYVMQPSGKYSCWECGATILSRKSAASHVHGRKGDFIGTVGGKEIPYCPNCEKPN